MGLLLLPVMRREAAFRCLISVAAATNAAAVRASAAAAPADAADVPYLCKGC